MSGKRRHFTAEFKKRVACDALRGDRTVQAARNACENKPALTAFPPEVRRFADTFAALQKARQQADYALDGRYEKADVQAAIDTVENTIAAFEQIDARYRRAFVAHVLFRRRP